MLDEQLVGLRAVELVEHVLEIHPEIEAVHVFEPPPVPLAQARLGADAASERIVARGLRLRAEHGTPFWDAVLLSCFGEGRAARPVLEQAGFHNSSPRRDLRLPTRSLTLADWDRMLGEVAPGGMLVLRSLVDLGGGETRHIPMLDFHCPASPLNEELAATTIDVLDIGGGYLLWSGDSYHLYGKRLFNDAELVWFLGRALLFAPIADRAWIAHQLIEGACGLRISQKPCGAREPVVVQSL